MLDLREGVKSDLRGEDKPYDLREGVKSGIAGSDAETARGTKRSKGTPEAHRTKTL